MSRSFLHWTYVFAVVVCLTIGGETHAASPEQQQISGICESAARVASSESGVPLDVLRAISLTETGRRLGESFLPWPWTVNMEGIGKWFDTVDGAKGYVDGHFARGARSFDVGCFQINYRWHGQAFESIDAMFDPVTNARYAASFLAELHSEFGDWSRAAGSYHSRTSKFAKKYRARFDRIRENLTISQPPVEVADVASPIIVDNPKRRVNGYPLLKPQRTVDGLASLVPLTAAPARLIDIGAVNRLIEPN